MRYFLHIAYDGHDYKGWQFQPNVKSVQGTIEKKLQLIFKRYVAVNGCGRTDSGVHSSQYFFHIELDSTLNFDLKFRLNKHLPSDILIHEVIPVTDTQHARYDAKSRTYDYFIHLNPDPVLTNYSSFYPLEGLNFEAMQTAAAILPLHENYRAMCKQPDKHNHTLCKISFAKLYVNPEQSRLRLNISANRFLRGMIRLIVDFLLQVGKGEMTIEQFEEILTDQPNNHLIKPALPNGLYLSKIEYPYLNTAPKPNFTDFLKIGLDNN
ncbi:MAG: tRNA pseudouridine38-40 synthase [Flavobacteriales bacterium]|jgi:tRNA pseudouridine38-40 synthase